MAVRAAISAGLPGRTSAAALALRTRLFSTPPVVGIVMDEPASGLGLRHRPAEAQIITDFLTSISAGPSGLAVEGEAGIGKTTVWWAVAEEARERGFRVLTTRGAAAESVMAYAALAELLHGADAAICANLPGPQRKAVDRVLLRADERDEPIDQQAVAAAFRSVLDDHAKQTRVLVAIDDAQWLDSSSAHVLGFAARRLAGPVGLLVTTRTGSGESRVTLPLHLPVPARMQRITLGSLSIGALHAVVSERLGRVFPRPTMVRIHAMSGGNPFYAIELARAFDEQSANPHAPLPGTLAEVIRARIGELDSDVAEVILATACLAAPTVELVQYATDIDGDRLVEALEEVEGRGVLVIDGNLLRFTHPLLARGVIDAAGPAHCRKMHRRLADIVDHPELRARHLALGTTHGDPMTLQALDAAAETARTRGAPAAAAELLDLAIRLAGDTPMRRIQSAGHHFAAGDPVKARGTLEETIAQMTSGVLRAEALNLLAVVRLFNDSHTEAAALFARALGDVGDHLALRVQILITLSFALFDAGDLGAAMEHAENGVTHAVRLGQPQLLGQALAMRAMLAFMRGDGLDETSLRRAVELEDPDANMPLTCRPSMQQALLLAFAGHLEPAAHQLAAVRRRCSVRGDEGDLPYVTFFSALIELWRGNVAQATRIAEDAMEHALQLGGDIPLVVARTIGGLIAAYAGREDAARREIAAAAPVGQRCGLYRLTVWQISALGFLEVSLGNYDAALSTLEPLLAPVAESDGTEIYVASFIPDAAETLIQLGRLTDAELLIERLEANGQRLDRAWMLAVGSRCRGMLLAARGDLEGASVAALQAMAEHDRLPMPFERARTQLLLGQLQRRDRRREEAASTLRQAVESFERLGTPRWADRARAELARTSSSRKAQGLTPAEQRVAELAVSGMANRDIAAALFISPKTVEANLTRIYRKLNVHTRTQLARVLVDLKQRRSP